MIPLTRRSTSRRLETALLSCSRQNLPRPARLYSAPSKRNQAPAVATATVPPVDDFPIGSLLDKTRDSTGSGSHGGNNNSSLSEGLHDFLRRKMPYTMLPSPSPSDARSQLNDLIFPSSPVQESLSIIDACLHGCYDVNRADFIFELLRSDSKGEAVLQPGLFNLFLEAYLKMGLEKDTENQAKWLGKAWTLYDRMEREKEVAFPITNTYAIMLKAWLRKANLKYPPKLVGERTPVELLRSLLNRDINVVNVVADRSLSPSDSAEIIQHLCRAAAEIGLHSVISDLGQAQAIAEDPLADVPEVMPVKITRNDLPTGKGIPDFSLDALAEAPKPDVEIPFNIAALRKHLAEVAYAQRVLPDDTAARQKLLEASVYDLAVQRLQHEAEKLDAVVGNQQKLLSSQLQGWMFEWHELLQRRLKAEIDEIIREESLIRVDKVDSGSSMRLGPFLSLLKPEKLSLIVILELMRLQGTGGVTEGMKTARALLTVGKAVEMEYKAQVLKKNNIHLPNIVGRTSESGFFTQSAFEKLQEWRKNANDFIEDSAEWTSEWTHTVRVRVGSFLVDCLMDVATVKRTAIDKRTGEEVAEAQPAFYHSYEYLRGHKLGVIRLNPVVAERLTKDDIKATLHPRHLPMLIKPKAWVSHDEGGYIYNKNSVMRLKDTQEQLTYLRHAAEAGNMEHVFAGLDVLGSTPWIVNREIFDIVLQVWNTGDRFVKIPEATYKEPEPAKPEDYDTDAGAKTNYLMAWKMWQLCKANAHSSRCSVNYKVEIARAFLADKMYFPHNIDFRGRAYPIPPHLNHIGDDLSRGLMKFADSKPLGATGLRWLKIHLANLAGFDKGSFDERVNFVHNHLTDIYDSAEKPLEGERWWMKAEDPWQCLSACKELHHALESGDPEGYSSNLPVHQDGTCNGLQHYAALGGDSLGARQVNLDITDRPADVYTHVAEMVESIIKTDVEKGHKYALMLQGKVSRKVVKQTVMTTVYGVTYVGARDQIERQLKDRGDLPAHEIWNASSYLARNVIGSIGDLFTGAKKIQDWLTLSARLISKSIPKERIEAAIDEQNQKEREAAKKAGLPAPRRKNIRSLASSRLPKEQMTSVVWTTPLGLPIVQPYRKTKRKQVMTSIQTVFISDPNAPAEVNAPKQSSAFPPNFIHSLDATHMMLTALECNKAGLTFASVHDSYWTHAATVNDMNIVIRDTFIALHESDVLDRLRQEFLDRYKDYQVPLISLRSKSLTNRLNTTMAEMAELATFSEELSEKDLKALKSALVVDAIEGTDTAESSPAIEEEVPKPKRRRRSAKQKAAEEAALALALAGEEPPKNEKAEEKPNQGEFVSRFVNLSDLLPPLPKKGKFNVQTIKKSKYFFS